MCLADGYESVEGFTYISLPDRNPYSNLIFRVCFNPISYVPLAQLDRASDYGSEGREFESSRARHMSGDDSGGDPPVPIPNTEVKPSSADGTWGLPLGE
jgi:hypothetical protein